MVRWPRLREIGYRMEESRWGRRIRPGNVWRGLKKGSLLFFYMLWWFFILLGGSLLAIAALTITWNVGPARMFGWNSLAFHEVLAVLAFGASIYYSTKAWKWLISKRFKV